MIGLLVTHSVGGHVGQDEIGRTIQAPSIKRIGRVASFMKSICKQGDALDGFDVGSKVDPDDARRFRLLLADSDLRSNHPARYAKIDHPPGILGKEAEFLIQFDQLVMPRGCDILHPSPV